jgi:hypothetical protein
MAQIKSSYEEVRIPFTKMSFTPDVPSTQLGPNEYNDGLNVESDVRGLRSVAGDTEFLSTVPGTPTYISGGFRNGGQFWFIVATYTVDPAHPTDPDYNIGRWYASDGVTDWYDVTPGGAGGPGILGYRQNTNITEAWNGTIPFFNDTWTAPMFLPEATDLDPLPIMVQYSNLIIPAEIQDITYVDPVTMRITFVDAYATAPYVAGQQIIISGVNNYFNGQFTVVSSTTTTIDYLAVPGASYPSGPLGSVSPAYTWNYNPNWKSVKANFLRLYNTPNVGSILVAGDLTAEVFIVPGQPETKTVEYPVTVQWSQAFGLNQAPLTWVPTIVNVANQLEVPLRGPAIDAFPMNGQFFLCSYWDTVVFSPLNYSTTSAPILGVRLFNQGRGMLTSNCFANTDRTIYGVDARDFWVFDGKDFTGLGNQRTKNWFFDQLDPQYHDRVFMLCNTQRNQIEVYYTTKPEFASPLNPIVNGVPNKMLAYRYDLDMWQAPRDVTNATQGTESPIYIYNEDTTTWEPNLGSRTIVYVRGVEDGKLVMKDQGYSFVQTTSNPNGDIESFFRRDNIKLLKDYSGKLMVHRILPEVVNVGDNELPVNPATSTHKGNVTVTIMGAESVASTPLSKTPVTMTIDTTNPWCQIDQNAFRVNTIEIGDTSNNALWMCSAATWQITQVEDDR